MFDIRDHDLLSFGGGNQILRNESTVITCFQTNKECQIFTWLALLYDKKEIS